MITFVTKGRGMPPARYYYRGRVLVDPAQGMSAFGQDPKGLEAKPASPVRVSGCALTLCDIEEGSNG